MKFTQWTQAVLRQHVVARGKFLLTFALVVVAGLASSPATYAGGVEGIRASIGKFFATALQGWQDPDAGGNGDYVFIDAPEQGTVVDGSARLSGRVGSSQTDPNGGSSGGGSFANQAQVVIAMIDTGGNPYHVDFRDETRLTDPSTYLNGFPVDATAAPLCFIDESNGQFSYNDDCSASWTDNAASDSAVVDAIQVEELVWYPGTRYMTKSFAHTDATSPVGFDEGGGSSGTSHGSWVSSAAVGNTFGTCPECMLIALEADSVDAIEAAYQWAAAQPWIDVITSSVSVGIIGAGVNPGIFPAQHEGAVAASRNGKIFLSAAGNGAANFGLVPTSTYLLDSGSPAVIPVGSAFDDGYATQWSDFPAEIMANGSSRRVADAGNMNAETSVGGTSFSAPAAAGVLANSLLQARRACKDFSEGATDAGNGVLTLLRNNGCDVSSGPFANGTLTRDELHEAFVKNAVPPYDQLSPIPGPVTWVKNAYGYVDLGHGVNNGGSTIQALVTDSLLGLRAIPVRPLEQFWYDDVVRPGQSKMWGSRPLVDGDEDAFPRADGACMPDCAPQELERYVAGFAGLNAGSSYQNVFDILDVSADEFAQAGPRGFGALVDSQPRVAGLAAEVGAIRISNTATHLEVRLNMAGALDGFIPAIQSTPLSYEVGFTAAHNAVAQNYRLSYEFQAADLFALLDGRTDVLIDAFEAQVDTQPDAQGISGICPIEADISASHFDTETSEAVWVVPLGAFNYDNAPVGNAVCDQFTRGGRALAAGDTLTDIAASSVLTVGVVNFGNGLGLFETSAADDYTLGGAGGGTDADGDGVADDLDQCPGTPANTPVDTDGCALSNGLSVSLSVNGDAAGTAQAAGGNWQHDIDFAQFTAVDGTYVVVAQAGTAVDSVTLVSASGQQDSDADGVADAVDNCPTMANPGQDDTDGDKIGDACDLAVSLVADPAHADVTDGPQIVTLSANVENASGAPLQYTFYFGDGEASKETTDQGRVTHSYDKAGKYLVQVVVVKGDNQNSASADTMIEMTTSVTVTQQDVVASLSLDIVDYVAPAPVRFDATGTVAPTGARFHFDFGDGSTQTGTEQTAEHVYQTPGTYSVVLTVTDANAPANSDTARASVTVVESQRTTAQLVVTPAIVQVGETVSFDASDSIAAANTTISRYDFDFDGDGQVDASGAESQVDWQFSAPGVYRPVLTVHDEQGGSSQTKAQVRVMPEQAAPAVRRNRGSSGAMGFWLLSGFALLGLRRRCLR